MSLLPDVCLLFIPPSHFGLLSRFSGLHVPTYQTDSSGKRLAMLGPQNQLPEEGNYK